MAKSKKKSASSAPPSGNNKAAAGVIGGLAAAAIAYAVLSNGGQNGPPAPPPPPPVAVQAIPEPVDPGPAQATVPAVPEMNSAVATLKPKGTESAPGSTPAAVSSKPGTGMLIPKSPEAIAADAAASKAAAAGRVRPKRRTADEVQISSKTEEDLDSGVRPAELSGYSDMLKLTGVGYNAERIGEWTVQPDPLPDGLPENKAAPKLKARINAFGSDWQGENVLFPVVPSPFVIVGSNGSGRNYFREVFNLDAGRSSGQIKGVQFDPKVHGLSPDGKYYAAVLEWTPQWVEIWDIQKKASLEHVPSVPKGTVDMPETPPEPAAPPPKDDAIKIGKSKPVPPVRSIVPRVSIPSELEPKFVGFPRADRLLVASNSRAQVWSIPERESICEFGFENPFQDAKVDHSWASRAGNPVRDMTVSPGGKYVALVQASDKFGGRQGKEYVLEVFELETGKLAGRFNIRERGSNFWSGYYGVAFSPSGTELAALFSTGEACRILIWSLAEGKIVDWVHFSKDQQPRLGNGYTSLAWFPSGDRFLIDGVHIVDRRADAWVYSIPDSRSVSPNSRRVVREDTITAIDDGGSDKDLVGFKLDLEQLDKATEIVVGGGSAIDTVLPPLTKIEEGAVPKDMTEQDEVPWSVAADPGPVMPRELGNASAKVPEVGMFTQVLNSRVDVSRAFFSFSEQFGRDLGKNSIRIEGYDLLKRKALKPIPMEFPFKFYATSPLGKRIALRVDAKRPTGRVEIYDADTGKPLCSWRPYDESVPAEKRKEVHGAMFLDEDHVGTLSEDNRFIVWEVPACKPVYSRDLSMLLMPTLSPGGKYLAFIYDDAIELCDTLTGELKGEYVTGNPAIGLTFHPAGEKMAALLEAAGNRFLVSVDLATGQSSPTYLVPGRASAESEAREQGEKPVGQRAPTIRKVNGRFELTHARAQVPMQWCGENHVLIDHSQLFDLELRRVVWNYTTRQPLLWLNTGERRLWYTTPPKWEWAGRGKTVSSSQLIALSLPHEAAREVIDEVGKPARLVFQPGSEVRLRLNLISPPNSPDFTQKVRDHLIREFAKKQIRVTDTGAAEIVLESTSGTGESVTYTGGLDRKETLQLKTVTMKATIQSEGIIHWESSYGASNGAGQWVWISDKVGLQAQQDRMLDQQIEALPYRFRPPAYVIHRDDLDGFGTTELSEQGFVEKGAGEKVTAAQ